MDYSRETDPNERALEISSGAGEQPGTVWLEKSDCLQFQMSPILK